ncbi:MULTISPECIES: hypothetical protein [Sphingomonas]|jgi:hypothetical protein|uniref:hypothetical protein n=1 Tax=Sphingomonas TaxID=13687 RepID=UPI000831FA44|nr:MULTISPECIES: hypothetical protein [Sphingomonas]MBY0301069.1 hypothetical protein [Sphingomonas ginsenosidimutans]
MLMRRAGSGAVPPAQPRWRIRPAAWAMTARCITAFLGNYAFAATAASLTARLLPIARVEATVWAMILSFLLYAIVGLWCFAEASLARVAAIVWGGALLMGAAVWLIGVRP